jgi:predicted alpha-1,2-mannosidase
MSHLPSLWAAMLLVGACADSTENLAHAPTTQTATELGDIAPYDPLTYVDPHIGTGGTGAQTTGMTPAAGWPNGLTSVGPDTRHSVYGAPAFYHFGGYHHDDDQVEGFSHTHAHGMGVNDFGAVHVMPRLGWDDAWTEGESRAAPFRSEGEQAGAGWYAVELDDDGTEVSIVATERGGLHRYRFRPGDETPVVVFDLGHRLGEVQIGEAWIRLDPTAGTVEGYQLVQGAYSGRFGGLKTHFVATVDPLPIDAGSWSKPDSPQTGEHQADGTQSGGWLVFPAGTEEVTLRVALSYVDHAGAWANHAAELEARSHDEVQASVEAAWRERLEVVRVSATEEQRRIFHTAHFHASQMPRRMDDTDGRYRGIDGEVHSGSEPYYTDFSLWDTFRTLHPWFILAHPDVQTAFLRSLVQMTKDGGSVPKWPLGHGYTGGMVGTPADQVFAGSALKGITGWDELTAFDACYEHAIGPSDQAGRAGIRGYTERGYVAFEDAGQPASRTLEFAYNDHTLALWADKLGRTEEAGVLRAQEQSWKNTFDAAQGFFVGRYQDGSFAQLESPLSWESSFVEGNATHYRWYVPQDVDGLIDLQHGGDGNAFNAAVQAYWEAVALEPDDQLPDDLYWHGNEPVLHHAALGSLAGHPQTSVDATRWVATHRYDDTPEGLDGNDDGGTLSAWYLFAALGLYPVAGTDRYAIHAPLFERVELDRPDGTLVIRAPGAAAQAPQIVEVRADGVAVDGWVISHAALEQASELTFQLDDG